MALTWCVTLDVTRARFFVEFLALDVGLCEFSHFEVKNCQEIGDVFGIYGPALSKQWRLLGKIQLRFIYLNLQMWFPVNLYRYLGCRQGYGKISWLSFETYTCHKMKVTARIGTAEGWWSEEQEHPSLQRREESAALSSFKTKLLVEDNTGFEEVYSAIYI